MKIVKFALAATAAFVGLATAYAANHRIDYTYVNLLNNGTYTKLTTTYDAANCASSSTRICAYSSPVDFGAGVTPTATQILAAGGSIKTNVNKIYLP